MIRASIASALLFSVLAAGCGGSEQAEPSGQTSVASTADDADDNGRDASIGRPMGACERVPAACEGALRGGLGRDRRIGWGRLLPRLDTEGAGEEERSLSRCGAVRPFPLLYRDW